MRRQGINAQLMIIDYYIVSNNYGGMVHEGHLRALEGSFLIQKRPYLPKFMLSDSLQVFSEILRLVGTTDAGSLHVRPLHAPSRRK